MSRKLQKKEKIKFLKRAAEFLRIDDITDCYSEKHFAIFYNFEL